MVNEQHPEELLTWYANGTLSGEERLEVEAHIRACEQCQAELELLQAVRTEIKSQSFERAPIEIGWMQLRKQIRQEKPAPRWWRPAIAAALLVIVAQTGLLISQWQPDAPGIYRPMGADSAPLLAVRFTNKATVRRIETVLREAGVEIVAGPGALGLYKLRLPENLTAEQMDLIIKQLKESGVVEHAAHSD